MIGEATCYQCAGVHFESVLVYLFVWRCSIGIIATDRETWAQIGDWVFGKSILSTIIIS